MKKGQAVGGPIPCAYHHPARNYGGSIRDKITMGIDENNDFDARANWNGVEVGWRSGEEEEDDEAANTVEKPSKRLSYINGMEEVKEKEKDQGNFELMKEFCTINKIPETTYELVHDRRSLM